MPVVGVKYVHVVVVIVRAVSLLPLFHSRPSHLLMNHEWKIAQEKTN